MLLSIGDLVEEFIVDMGDEPRRGVSSPARAIRVRGGSAANVAAITCERGGAARFVGQIGADAVGRSLAEDLARRGVDVRVRATGVTGVTIGLRQSGYVTSIYERGTSVNFEEPGQADLDGVTQVYVPGRSLMTDPLASAVDDLLGRCAELRVPVCLGVMTKEELEEYGIDHFLTFVEMLRPAYVVVGTREHSALGLDDNGPLRGARATVIRHLEHTVVITPADAHHRATPADLPVRDRTGSEDGFVAGYLLACAQQAAQLSAVDAGNRIASLVMAGIGPTTEHTATRTTR